MPGVLSAGSLLDGRYRIEQEIARGGMGVVYRATHVRLGCVRAVKLITPRFAQDPEYRERFHREATAAAAIEHPHVVAVHDSGEVDGWPYLVMQYVDGVDLQRLIERDGALDRARGLRLLRQLGDALDAAHAVGVVHRDVKPSNILVLGRAPGEVALLADFGLAKQLAPRAGAASELWGGTLEYASPEQVAGGAVDARSDVYSLGCVLYHALSGRPPGATQFSGALPSLAGAGSPVPDELDAVIARARERDPQRRYASAGELARAARAAAEPSPASAPTRLLPTRAGREQAAVGDQEASGGWRRWRSWAPLALAGVLVVALAAGAGTLLARNASGLGGLLPSVSPAPPPAATTTPQTSATPSPSATPPPAPTATPTATAHATPTATPTASATPTVTPSSTPTPPPSADPEQARRRAVERAVQRHWALISAGRYAAAYDDFAPALRAQIGRRGWIAQHAHDDLSRVAVDVAVTLRSPTTASARIVSLQTVAIGSGCHTWTGSYDLQRIDGAWRIAQPHLTRHPC